LTATADDLGVTVRIVPAEEWTHGEAKGICEQLSLVDVQPLVEVRDRANEADLARTLIHEYAHALLHFDVDDDTKGAASPNTRRRSHHTNPPDATTKRL